MSKSLNNFYRIEDIEEKGYEPLALRYLYLTAHYRKRLNFTWDALEAAATGLTNLRSLIAMKVSDTFGKNPKRTMLSEEKLGKIQTFSGRFREAIENDLQMPEALAVTWEVAKSNIPPSDKRELIEEFDRVLGLDLLKGPTLPQGRTLQNSDIPENIRKLVEEREKMRAAKDWQRSDAIRQELLNQGWSIEDRSDGPVIKLNGSS